MKFTVGRKEEKLLVLVSENEEKFKMEANICPDAKEGDIISIEILEKETEDIRRKIEEKFNQIKK